MGSLKKFKSAMMDLEPLSSAVRGGVFRAVDAAPPFFAEG
jgi:hypothetical protein